MKYPEKLMCKKSFVLLPKTKERTVVIQKNYFYEIKEVKKLDYFPMTLVLINVVAGFDFEFYDNYVIGEYRPYIWDYFYTESELRKEKLKKLKRCLKSVMK